MILDENALSKIIVNSCFEIHVALGPGLFESVYEEILYKELLAEGLNVERQKEIPVIWKGKNMGIGFKADLVIENKVIVELKSIQDLNPVHFKQLQTYLKLTNIKLGLLINFNEPLIKDGIKRVVNNL
jgi:GxxExxY protein